ncbi:MAG: hypothetical protein HYU39_04935 [Thaumarchaeota archaeon]|nr:hypothetical protein [Nitrososphaerota archaeon]
MVTEDTVHTKEKDDKLEIKDAHLRVTERDYRALIATLLVTGLLILLLKGDHQAASTIGPLAGSAIGWYFTGGRQR